MNLITLILTIAILFGLTDFLTERYPRLQRDIYYIALFVMAFLFSIKYYYGPDISSYVPFYDTVPSVAKIIAEPDELRYGFEPGFGVFCRVLNDLGLSYYMMTVVLTCLYFLTVHMLFRRIERKRAFALAILVVVDFNIICYEFRQCLAVIAFLWMVLCLDKKSYLWAMVCAVCAVLSHKSGLVVVVPTLVYHIIHRSGSLRTLSQLLLVALVILFLLPMTNMSFDFLNRLPLPDRILSSIEHHLSLGRQVQVVFILYAVVLVCLVHFAQYTRSRKEAIATAALIGLICVVALYQYYFLLNRLRSYFTPLVIVFLFNRVQTAENEHVRIPYGALVKQLTCAVVMLYMVHATYAVHRSGLVLKNKVNDTCTVFDLIDHRAVDVQNSQMKRARAFWEEDYMRHENNKLKK